MTITFKPQDAPLKKNTLIYNLAHPTREVPGPTSPVMLLSAARGSYPPAFTLHTTNCTRSLARPAIEDDRRAGMTCAGNWLVRRRRRGVKRRARLVFWRLGRGKPFTRGRSGASAARPCGRARRYPTPAAG
jgi:hypothetical protein